MQRRYEPWWWTRIHRVDAWIAEGVLTSAVVWLAAVPLVAFWFHLVSPIGILLNIPLIPLTSLALLLGAAGMGLGHDLEPSRRAADPGRRCALAADGGDRPLGCSQSWGHRFVAGPSWGTVAAFYFLLLLATIASSGRHGARPPAHEDEPGESRSGVPCWSQHFPAGCCVGLAEVPTRWQGDMLAIGHGLAIVLQLPDGQTILYDCGRMGDPRVGAGSSPRRSGALASPGLTRSTLATPTRIITMAFPTFSTGSRIGEVVIPPGFENEQNPESLAASRPGSEHAASRCDTIAAPATWNQGSAQITVLHPPPDWHPETPDNARSLVLDVAHGGRHLLLTGDLDQLGLVELVAQTQPEPIDLMLAPHHGGKTANPSWLYSWARPRAVDRQPAAARFGNERRPHAP